MSTLTINGPAKLHGELRVNGAKNSAVTALAAALLTDQLVRVENVPAIEDVKRLGEILEKVGVEVEVQGSVYSLNPARVASGNLPAELIPKLRAAVLLVGPLLARFGRVDFPHPGGCVIGRRPIDFFLDGFKALGAEVAVGDRAYAITAPQGLRGGRFVFPRSSVTGTETLLMAACLARGTSVLVNAAMEPEVTALARYLQSVGAKVEGVGSPTLTVDGVASLAGGTFKVAPDRIEAGSFLAMAAATNSSLRIAGCLPQELDVPLALLAEMGVPLQIGSDYVDVAPWQLLQSVPVTTHEYPGFPTDIQAPFTVLLTQASGTSLVHETIFESRMLYVDLLNRMGANITLCDPHRALVSGPTPLRGAYVEGPDIRAGLALVIAGLVASGVTRIGNAYQIDRGYECLEERLAAVGAPIRREE